MRNGHRLYNRTSIFEMEAVLRENKGLTPQAGGLPFKALFNISHLETLSGNQLVPSPYNLLHIPSQLKL